jgi:DNA polymerase III subunit epsilon
MLREIVLDTETTGLDPEQGHRLVEIACVEIINLVPTGNVLHRYVNPERDMPSEAAKVHGLTEAFLKNHPVFAKIAQDVIDFVDDAPLVIHNAVFDLKFINAEFARLGLPSWSLDRATDTVKMARKKYPGLRNNLDALCSRLGIDNSKRDKHGALLDASLDPAQPAAMINRRYRAPRVFTLSDAEKNAHNALIEGIPNAVWKSVG